MEVLTLPFDIQSSEADFCRLKKNVLFYANTVCGADAMFCL